MQGSSYRLRVYESSVLGVPVLDQTIYGSATGQSGIFFVGMDQQGDFLDLQGTFTIDMLSGTVGIDYVYFVTEIDGIDYTTAVSSLTVVPEPTFSGLGILAGLVAVPRRRAFTISAGHVETKREYVLPQEEHHRGRRFGKSR